jgi:signal transduction histidine kinase
MRLDGVEWIESREPLLRMAGVAAGDHEIEAAASLDGINWGPSGRLQFHVDPPWYARGLVVSFGIAMIIAIGLLAHGLRTAHLLDLERQRVRIAMDLHDELGAGLGSLGILGGVVADGSAPSHERQRLGEQIARTSAELGSSLHDIVYSLRTGEARLDSLGEQLANRGRTLFTGKNVRLTTSLARCPQCALAPSVSRHAYRIAVEALHNAARHANAANVHIGIESTELGRIRLWIQDDGQGIDPATLAEPGGMGLVAMRQRALAIGGDLTIQSTPENGTRIEMTFDGQGRRVHSIAWRRVWQRATSAVLHS